MQSIGYRVISGSRKQDYSLDQKERALEVAEGVRYAYERSTRVVEVRRLEDGTEDLFTVAEFEV